jgi:hypothetical protein
MPFLYPACQAAQVCVVLAALRDASFLLTEFAVWLGNSSMYCKLVAPLAGKVVHPRQNSNQDVGTAVQSRFRLSQ